jgi:hypothetical protein
MNHGFEMDLFGRNQRKPLPQIKTHLMSKQRPGAGAGAITLEITGLTNTLKQIEILFHD